MNNKLDKKSSCILTITLILLISLLVNVYQSIAGIEYKKEIGNLLNEIQSEKFLKFLYNVIVSFKRQWGY